MEKGEKKAGKLKAGMENLSENGRAYIKNMTKAMLFYQNSLISSDGTVSSQPDKRKKLPNTKEDICAEK
jgi:hypothetical protein